MQTMFISAIILTWSLSSVAAFTVSPAAHHQHSYKHANTMGAQTVALFSEAPANTSDDPTTAPTDTSATAAVTEPVAAAVVADAVTEPVVDDAAAAVTDESAAASSSATTETDASTTTTPTTTADTVPTTAATTTTTSGRNAPLPTTTDQPKYGKELGLPGTYVRCGRCATAFAIAAVDLGTGPGRYVIIHHMHYHDHHIHNHHHIRNYHGHHATPGIHI